MLELLLHRQRRSATSKLLRCLLLALLLQRAACQTGPTAVITSNATQTNEYSVPLVVTYFEPANCTVTFSEGVLDFDGSLLAGENTTIIENFQRVDGFTFSFQVTSTVSNNVTLRVPAGVATNFNSVSNSAETGFFTFEFFTQPPSFTVSIDGDTGIYTNSLAPVIVITFDQTTRHDSSVDPWVTAEDILFTGNAEPFTITTVQTVSDREYRFAVSIQSNQSGLVSCVPADTESFNDSKVFPCSLCDRYTERCISESLQLPANNLTEPQFTMEFPLEVIIGPIPELGIVEERGTIIYDTYVPAVQIEAQSYAREGFWITVTWDEELRDLLAERPTLSADSPVVDEALFQNQTILIPGRSYEVFVRPFATGQLTISINGSQFTSDLAGNTNDARIFTEQAAGDVKIVQFSFDGGPPLEGELEFEYIRQRFPEEYPEQAGPVTPVTPSLSVAWSGFTTAVRYDCWIQWGFSEQTEVARDVSTESLAFANFDVLLGSEYTAYLRAYNFYNNSILVSKVFTLPEVQLIANGTYANIPMPNLLSRLQTPVELNLILPSEGFLAISTQKVIAFKTASPLLGDRDPCADATNIRQCTFLNFHLEVPDSDFTVFKQPIRLQFIFGVQGWPDLDFRPQLFYWEEFAEEWRPTDETCTSDKAYNRWNELHRIYEVSICHFSQFSIFEVFTVGDTSTTIAATDSDDSFEDPLFWVIMICVVVLGILACCCCYWAFALPALQDKELSVSQLGIKSMTERLPKRFGGNPEAKPVDETDLLVPVGSPAIAIEDQQPQAVRPLPIEAQRMPSEQSADAEAAPLPLQDGPPSMAVPARPGDDMQAPGPQQQDLMMVEAVSPGRDPA